MAQVAAILVIEPMIIVLPGVAMSAARDALGFGLSAAARRRPARADAAE